MKTLRILIALMIAGVASPLWARAPRSREFCGRVESAGTNDATLTVSLATGQRLTAVCTPNTIFIHDGQTSQASALGSAQSVCVYYRVPFFGPPYLTKVVW